MDREPPKHGTATGYCNYQCRCQPCTTAWTQYTIAYRAKRRELIARGLMSIEGKHGKDSTYTNYGCRCNDCREAHRLGALRYRHPIKFDEKEMS
jgi:hypothetical protein